MIDWRSHALSLVAVFLALGIGIAIGGMLGSKAEAVVSQQQEVIRSLQDRLSGLEDQVRDANAVAAAQEAARAEADETAARLRADASGGLLDGKTVAIINVGAPDAEGETLSALRAAGASRGAVISIDPSVVAGQDGVLARLAAATGLSQPLAGYVGAWAREVLNGDGASDPVALDAAVRAGAVSWVPPADASAGPAPDAIVVLCPEPLDARQWQSLVSPWLTAARADGVRAVVATFGTLEPSMGEILRCSRVATVANLGGNPGDLALVRTLAGTDGHFGTDAKDDGWWPPDPRSGPARPATGQAAHPSLTQTSR